MSKRAPHRKPLFEVRHSRIHGYGVFALRRIRKGTTVIEYLGDRVSHALANERYADKDPKDGHTFLFTVDAKTVIDAGVNGNEARFVNHGCHPNCQTVNTGKRIFIEALRTIQPGEELAYDYQIQRDDDDPADVDVIFACRCGAKRCRGSMLEAPKKRREPQVRRRGRAPKRKVMRKAVRKSVSKTVRKSVRKTMRKIARKRPR
jgi:SET domain-containing protein